MAINEIRAGLETSHPGTVNLQTGVLTSANARLMPLDSTPDIQFLQETLDLPGQAVLFDLREAGWKMVAGSGVFGIDPSNRMITMVTYPDFFDPDKRLPSSPRARFMTSESGEGAYFLVSRDGITEVNIPPTLNGVLLTFDRPTDRIKARENRAHINDMATYTWENLNDELLASLLNEAESHCATEANSDLNSLADHFARTLLRFR
jgi:hypothetical protein